MGAICTSGSQPIVRVSNTAPLASNTASPALPIPREILPDDYLPVSAIHVPMRAAQEDKVDMTHNNKVGGLDSRAHALVGERWTKGFGDTWSLTCGLYEKVIGGQNFESCEKAIREAIAIYGVETREDVVDFWLAEMVRFIEDVPRDLWLIIGDYARPSQPIEKSRRAQVGEWYFEYAYTRERLRSIPCKELAPFCIRWCDRAIELGTTFNLENAHTNKIFYLRHVGRLNEALALTNSILKANKMNAFAHQFMSLVLEDMERFELAIQSSEHAMKLFQNADRISQCQSNIQRAETALRQKHVREQLAIAQEVAALRAAAAKPTCP